MDGERVKNLPIALVEVHLKFGIAVSPLNLIKDIAQLAGAVEYTNCISEEE